VTWVALSSRRSAGDPVASFEAAINTVLAHEGGYTVDHAGATNYGVTIRAARAARMDIDGDGDVDADDVAVMTVDDAIWFYREHYWLNVYNEIGDQPIATKVFDLAVNMGHARAHKLLQTALRQMGCALVVDGILGEKTLAEMNSVNAERLLSLLRVNAANFYHRLVGGNPGRYGRYLSGWLRRAYS